MKIGNTDLAERVYVIAEVGGNHDGDPATALILVEAAAKAGANAVKFQTYSAERLVHPDMESMPLAAKRFKRQYDRFKSLELNDQDYREIIDRCGELNIDFLTTPFDVESLHALGEHMPAVKIASGDLTYYTLLDAAVAAGKPVILSTGMADMAEILDAAKRIPAAQRVLLHCVSVYPAPDRLMNLPVIPALQAAFPDTVIGYSDHSIGPEASLAAVVMGARVIEKHFTLDQSGELGDHRLSLDPDGLAEMVSSIRRLQDMLNTAAQKVSDDERNMHRLMRRGVYAARNLPTGHVLTDDDLLIIRPPTSISPTEIDSLIGRRLTAAVSAMSPLDRSGLE